VIDRIVYIESTKVGKGHSPVWRQCSKTLTVRLNYPF